MDAVIVAMIVVNLLILIATVRILFVGSLTGRRSVSDRDTERDD